MSCKPVYYVFSALVFILALQTACNRNSSSNLPALPQDLDSSVAQMARAASTDVGVVDFAFKGAGGVPVILLEEFHNSRASQVQHAITLVRLYDQQKLRSIALEGYLKERPKIDGTWFTRKWPDQTPLQNARIAVRLLKEGEISDAEFMKLVYDDLNLYPVETTFEYNVRMSDKAVDAMLSLAQQVDPSRAKEIQRQLDEASAGVSVSAEDQLATAEDLEAQRVNRGIRLSTEQLADWQSWLAFWRGRAGGNRTMQGATLEIVESSTSPVAMVVGSAHTRGLGALFVSAGRGFAVITPLALKQKDTRGDIDKTYDLKDRGNSVEPDGMFMTVISTAVRTKKPEPVIFPVPWFEAKARIYQFTNRITTKILGPPSPPNGGEPPFTFGDDEFRSPLVQVDPHKIVYLPDDHGRRCGRSLSFSARAIRKDVRPFGLRRPVVALIKKTVWILRRS